MGLLGGRNRQIRLNYGEQKMTRSLEIKPITLSEANAYVETNHRHHGKTAGCKFGVAICGRPISRYMDDGETIEIYRNCTDGTKNACSALYGAACRVARDMGYSRVITYTLQSESGSSLKASGFTCEGEAGGPKWTTDRSAAANQECSQITMFVEQKKKPPPEMKKRWVKMLK